MNPGNDQRYLELAAKVLAGRATKQESAELTALLLQRPDLKAKFDRLRAEADPASLTAPVADRARPEPASRWKLGLVAGGVVLGLALIPVFQGNRQNQSQETPPETQTNLAGEKTPEAQAKTPDANGVQNPASQEILKPGPAVVRVAVLDTNEVPQSPAARMAFFKKAQEDLELLQQTWEGTAVEQLHSAEDLRLWEQDRPADAGHNVMKIIFDRAASELRVHGQWKGTAFDQSFPAVPGLATALGQAGAFIDRVKAE
jgi:hypothetical protein